MILKSNQNESGISLPQELVGIFSVLALIWIVFVVNQVLTSVQSEIDLNDYGLRPRDVNGLIGVVTMPFLHGNWSHIWSNSFPLFFLLCLLVGTRNHAWLIAFEIILLNGVILWLVGRDSIHVGASGLVFGLIAFLICAGYFEKKLLPMAVAGITLFLYGGTLFFGMLPVSEEVSWDGHLTGVVAGLIVAYLLSRFSK